MVAEIGKSADPSTATRRDDASGSEPASFRYNNPGAQYPSERAARFGQTGYGIIGGGHKIARFPSPVNGAAANFDLLSRNYVGMQMGAAGKKWTGSYGFGIPGYSNDMILTKEMLDDPKHAIAILKAIAGRESGHGNNLSEDQWQQAHQMFTAGSANAFLAGGRPKDEELMKEGTPGGAVGPTGAGLLRRARGTYPGRVRQQARPKGRSELERTLGLRRVHVLVGVPGGRYPLWLSRRQRQAF